MSECAVFANQLLEKIEHSKDIAIISHISPDGDNLGSLEAMYGYLKGMGKDPIYLSNDDVPEEFGFLPSVRHRISVDDINKAFDLCITLDSSDVHRLGTKGEAIFQKAKCTANIDHHMSNTQYADLNFVLPQATSTGEVLYRILSDLGADMTPEMATGLYTAISTDTGSFQYDSVNSNTHHMVAKLFEYGCDHNQVVQSVYQSKSREKLTLMARVLSNIYFLADGKVSVVCCSIDDIEKSGASSQDTEGIVEEARNINGVEMAIFLKEKVDEVKLSFRSKSYLNCTEFAEVFGGGGHVRAAGASSPLKLEAVQEKIEKLVAEKLKEYL